MVENTGEQPQLPIEDFWPAKEEEQAVEAVEHDDNNTKNKTNHIVIDDTERGGMSERERLGIPIDEEGHPEGIRNIDAYGAALVDRFSNNPRALVEKYRDLLSSGNVEDKELAKSMLVNSERLRALLKEEYSR